jgi:DNA-binding CsgD family transcriptional regulator
VRAAEVDLPVIIHGGCSYHDYQDIAAAVHDVMPCRLRHRCQRRRGQFTVWTGVTVERGELVAFLSYAHLDDEHEGGGITAFRKALEGEVRVQTGRRDVRIFQDREDIAWGREWEERVDSSLEEATFLVPVVTPSFFASDQCRRELRLFLDRERRLGRRDRVLPVYWVSATPIQDPARRAEDELARALAARQFTDWRELRFQPLAGPQARRALAGLATHLSDALDPARGTGDAAARGQGHEGRRRARRDSSAAGTARFPGPGRHPADHLHVSPGVPIVGREPEVGLLAAFTRQAAGGRGAAVLVEGEPGIGKTMLLDVVAAECARRGVQVLRGGADELERRLPFAAVSSCLRGGGDVGDPADPGLARLSGLLHGEGVFGRSLSAANHEFVVTEAILDLVDRWCAAGPLALVLDDVQWADPASVVVLHRLGRAVEEQRLPLLMVLAMRSVARSEAAAGLTRSLAPYAQPLMLAPLPEPAVASLVGQLLGAPAGPHLLSLAAGAGGNPMYVGELVAALSREGLVQLTDGVAEVAGDVVDPAGRWVPQSLVEAVQRRLDFLPPKVRDTLEMAAVLGPAIDVAELATVLDMSVAALSEVVREAMAARLLADTGRVLMFRHDLIRQALAGHRPGPVRTALRLRAGQVLAAAGAPVERVAEHLLQAGAALDRAMVEWLVRSADALIVRAPESAVRLLSRALATAEDDITEVLRFHQVRALLWAGDVVEAEQAAQVALAAGPAPERAGTLHWLLAQSRYRQGRLPDVVAATEEAMSLPQLTPAEVGRFQGFAAICLILLEQFDASKVAAGKAIAAGEAHQDPTALAFGHNSMACYLAREDLTEALRLNERAVAAFEAGAEPDFDVDPYVIRAYCLVALDRLEEADDALAKSILLNQQAGGAFLPSSYFFRARLRFLQGRWDDALAEIEAGLDVPDPYQFAPSLRSLAELIAIHRGTHAPDGGTGDPDCGVGNQVAGFVTLWRQALAAEARGDPRQALAVLQSTWDKPAGLQPRRLFYEFCPDVARLAAATADTGCGRELAATAERLAAQAPSPSMEATALLCEGLADADPAPLLAAARSFHQAGWPLFEGYGYELAAALLAEEGRTAEARDALDGALVLYAELGAAWDTSRTEARLRQLGVRRGRRQPLPKRPRRGWEALTDTERRVADLVAEGLSNPDIATRMFLSRSTVQSHVSSILAKLELDSRVELRRRGGPEQPPTG